MNIDRLRYAFKRVMDKRPFEMDSGEKKIWQRRFWEHVIRNEEDWRRHVDYIHYNPVKHGYAMCPSDWQYSSFSRAVERGWYSQDWGNHEPGNIKGVDWE